MRRIIITVICLISGIGVTTSQSIQREYNVTPVTPEAAALARMVNYPVSHNTGLPVINIPLYELVTDGMRLPIELVYHSGGFKINEQAGRTGLGWSMSCDLQITRTINGLDDLGPGGYIYNGKVKPMNKNSTPFNDPNSYPMDKISQYELVNSLDGMPDKFYYKLLNKSGSFYFQKNATGNSYTIVTLPYEHVRIEFDPGGSFVVTDDDGTVYYFGLPGTINEDNIDRYGIELSGSSRSMDRTSWKCMKIVNPDKTGTILFEYSKKPRKEMYSYQDRIEYWRTFSSSFGEGPYYAYESQFSSVSSYEDMVKKVPFHLLSSPKYMVHTGGGKSEFHMPYINTSNTVTDKTFTIQSTNNHIVYQAGLNLSRISFRGGQVEFIGNKILESIRIIDHKESKTIQFYQSYKNALYEANARHLNGADFIGTNYLDSLRIGREVYSLGYHDKYCFGNHLKGHDVWGYANFRTMELSPYSDPLFFLPQIRKLVYKGATVLPFYIGGMDILMEQPDEKSVKHGVLKRIIYPTGGFVDFEFESNKYDELKSTNGNLHYISRPGGGLRIRSATYYDSNRKTAKQKYYAYGNCEEGSGDVKNAPEIIRNGNKIEYKGYEYTQIINYAILSSSGINMVIGKDSLTTYLPASMLDYSYPGGAPVYYTKVTEYEADMGLNTGKTVYEYYPYNEFMLEEWNTTIIRGTNVPYLRTDWYSGVLKSVSEYKYVNGKFNLLHRQKYQYDVSQKKESLRVVYAFPSVTYQGIQGQFSGHPSVLYEYNSAQYAIPVGKVRLSDEEEVWVEASDTLRLSSSYHYDNPDYDQPSRIITDDGIRVQVKHLAYTYDFPGDDVCVQMGKRNIVSPVIQEIVKNQATGNELSRVKVNYRISGQSFLKDKIESSYHGNPLETELSFDRYDVYGNIQQVTGRDAIPKSYIWGYSSRYPVAEISGKEYTAAVQLLDMNKISEPASESALRTELEKLYGLDDAMINTYTHKPLSGISSHSSPQKIKTYYEYDSFGTLQTIRDQDLKVIKTIDYHHGRYSVPMLYTANIPRMESYNKFYSSGEIGLQNYVSQGGTTRGVETVLPTQTGNYAYSETEKLPASGFVRITFESLMSAGTEVIFDFIQDGSVVATKTYKCNAISQPANNPEFYLPSGDYTIVFKTGVVSYSRNPIKFLLTPSSGSAKWIKSKDTIRLQKGLSYRLGVSDYL